MLMEKLNINNYVKRKKEIAFQNMDQELVLLNLESGVYYSTNKVGQRIWQLCDGSMNIREIILKLSDDFDKSSDDIKNDVLEYINDLINEDLLSLYS